MVEVLDVEQRDALRLQRCGQPPLPGAEPFGEAAVADLFGAARRAGACAPARFAGGIGRTCSPLAGGVILAAGLAGINPMELVKRTAPACIVMLAVSYVMF